MQGFPVLLAMGSSALLATTLLALQLGGPGQHSTLARVAPRSLATDGAPATLPSAMLGYAWARRGRTLALVVKPADTGQPIRIVDVRSLRTMRTIAVGDRDVCGLTFDGPLLVALVADRPCYWKGGTFSVLRIDPSGRRPRATVAVAGIHTAWPTNLTFGDGQAFVAHAGGGVDAIDLRTGAVTPHRPRRMLAKGEGIVPARWLGGHLLGLGPRIVDVRTWRERVPLPRARGIAPAGTDLVAYGPGGATVLTRAGRVRFRVLAGEQVGDVRAVGSVLYANVGWSTEVVDLRTRTTRDAGKGAWLLLAP